MSGAGSDPEGPAESFDAIADVLQACTLGGMSWVKSPTVVRDADGQRPVVGAQPKRDPGSAAGAFCGVLDRLGAGEVDGRLGFVGAARRGPFDAHVDRCARRLRL